MLFEHIASTMRDFIDPAADAECIALEPKLVFSINGVVVASILMPRSVDELTCQAGNVSTDLAERWRVFLRQKEEHEKPTKTAAAFMS